MRLAWNEVRVRAAQFAREWKDAAYEKGETQSFYNDFFDVFGVARRRVARFEQHVKKLNDASGYIDLFWPGMLLVEQKSAGRSLTNALDQAGEYFDALPDSQKPRYLLVSDFQNFELYDLDERHETVFALADLPDNVEAFGFVMGVHQRTFKDQDPVNIAAAELVGKLHDQLAESGYTGHDLEQFLVRVVFCLFADDTGIFEQRGALQQFIEDRTSVDGTDLGLWLSYIFDVLNTPEDARPNSLDEDLAALPYVNGDLFDGRLQFPSFNSAMREALLEACRFDWSNISPAIFGALFQSVMDPEQRRAQGAHYTTEQNILKVIEPLFLDDLRAELAAIKTRRGPRRLAALGEFLNKLAGLRLFDPACGCGNFLIIAYRELRLLEIEAIREMRRVTETTGQMSLSAELASDVNVDQCYGIELSEFPARIAETALWMMDHIMNNRLSHELGQVFVRIPLETSPTIVCGDALEADWAKVLSPGECSYLLGNPPFVGSKLQTPKQRKQVRSAADIKGGTLDYVTAWFVKAAQYAEAGTARIGFVATNSITQGEQVGQLWPILFERHSMEISFAHRTFPWGSDARGKAHVHVVIIGLDHTSRVPTDRHLFSYPDPAADPDVTSHKAISAYLTGADTMSNPHLTVRSLPQPRNGLPRLVIGSKPVDGGHLIMTDEERKEFLTEEPAAGPWLRPFVGAYEYVRGTHRWILALHNAQPHQLSALPLTTERLQAVADFRSASKDAGTRKLAKTPYLYHVNTIPTAAFLVIPKSSSENREYVPIGWLDPPTMPSDAVFVLNGATLTDFGLLTSAMHMAWMRQIGGRIKSDYRYSIEVVYNAFPTPDAYRSAPDRMIQRIETAAKAVLASRANHPESTLADMYAPNRMPQDLRQAHNDLDTAVDRLYRRRRFTTELDRVEYLLTLYEQSHNALAV